MPDGRPPVSLKVGAGLPVAVTVKVPAWPWVKVVELAEVMVGASSTVRVKAWVASGESPLVASMVIGKLPDWVGSPESTPALVRVTPFGSDPVSVKVGEGTPVAVKVKVSAEPSKKVVVLAEVISGAALTVNRNSCCCAGENP